MHMLKNYMAQNKNLTDFSVDSEKQVGDIKNSHSGSAQDDKHSAVCWHVNEQFAKVVRIWLLNQSTSCSINMTLFAAWI